MPNISRPVIRTLSRFTESFVFYPIELPDIKTLYWKTVPYIPVYFMPVIKKLYAVPDDVLTTGIDCTFI